MALLLLAAGLGGLVVVSVAQALLRHARSNRRSGRQLPLGKIAAWVLAVVVAIALLRFGLNWIVVAASALLAVGSRLTPLIRLLPFARTLANWARARSRAAEPRTSSTAGPPKRMSKRDALEVLGLEQGATAEEINQAYKSMMTKVHPDRGGSTFLAAQVNEARDALLSR